MTLKHFFILTLLLFFTQGCKKEPTPPKELDSSQIISQQQKVKKAFNEVDTLKERHSVWFDREQSVPLVIITTAYIDNQVLKLKEYKAYKKLAQKLTKNKNILGKDIGEKFSSVKFVDFDKDESAQLKFHAVYKLQNSDKEKLTDILTPKKEQNGAELLVRINFEEFKKGNLTIEGYKTIKQINKEKNS